ncbi:Fur family ferric uptake transcriptional regulator [Lachnotalea glycerini]|uniref:Fur family ferric uptake transcriptional regulator n=1 Tax=Lachnotalea glycerini TaxID=1763509 RepID=A0A255I474_9FIRM|nr:Fur family transcriptional regulator [Lachnotalea glycerini]PXV93487.1 Fur family ferric uptake transcriptional regulator [Lachnotalea glycerini]RDY32451.1 transcriptional repressor [Lachnotalea glycerini]
MSVDKDRFKELLRKNGLKITNQRVRVLEVLSNSPDKHLTAEEIYELIKVDYPEIGLATVYRTIQLLLELNLIDRINLDDGFVRYEIGNQDDNPAKHHHHHLICVNCGKVFSFEDDLLDELEKRIMDHLSFKVLDHEVKLYGKCKDCSAKEKE